MEYATSLRKIIYLYIVSLIVYKIQALCKRHALVEISTNGVESVKYYSLFNMILYAPITYVSYMFIYAVYSYMFIYICFLCSSEMGVYTL